MLQESADMVVVGGACWGPLAKLDKCPSRQVEVDNRGAVAIKPIKVIPDIVLETEQRHKLAIVRCLLRTFKKST